MKNNTASLLKETIINEITAPTPIFIKDHAQALYKSFDKKPLGIFFYGSVSRKKDDEGIIDFYIIFDNIKDLPFSYIGKFANFILPPNVIYHEFIDIKGNVKSRAKVAFLTLKQFYQKSKLSSWDTTIWARFSQPVKIIFYKDDLILDSFVNIISFCILTAVTWSLILSNKNYLMNNEYWLNLFSQTYKVELRVEKKGRERNLIQNKEEYFDRIFLLSMNLLDRENIGKSRKNEQLRWEKIKLLGKILNLLRLIKAAFTFKDGVDYLLWKIQRHQNKKIPVSNFEKKHPILTLPVILLKMLVLFKIIK